MKQDKLIKMYGRTYRNVIGTYRNVQIWFRKTGRNVWHFLHMLHVNKEEKKNTERIGIYWDVWDVFKIIQSFPTKKWSFPTLSDTLGFKCCTWGARRWSQGGIVVVVACKAMGVGSVRSTFCPCKIRNLYKNEKQQDRPF